MSYKKNDLLMFIKKQEQRALRLVANKWDSEIVEEENRLLEPYADALQMMHEDAHRLYNRIYSLQTALKLDENLSYGESRAYNPEYVLEVLEDLMDYDTARYIFKRSCNFGESVKMLTALRDKELESVVDNYSIVYNNAKSLRTGKQICKYLLNLGFDLSEVPKAERKAPQVVKSPKNVPVDVSKLYLNGEAK